MSEHHRSVPVPMASPTRSRQSAPSPQQRLPHLQPDLGAVRV